MYYCGIHKLILRVNICTSQGKYVIVISRYKECGKGNVGDMAGKWDSNLKRLVEANPQAFVTWLVKGAVVIRELSIELNRDIYIDILYEILLDGEIVLVHIEFQRYDDKEMARRVLEYNVFATCKYNLPVLSFVIYLKKEGKIVQAPLVRKLRGGREIWRFNFTNVPLWEVSTEELRNVQSVGILPLLALTREGARPEVVDEALHTIEQSPIDRNARDNLLTIALTLARLVLSGLEHVDWLKKRFYMYQDLIRDTEIYQLIMQEGLQEGLQQGLQQQMQQDMSTTRQVMLHSVQARFPELADLAEARSNAVTDFPLLLKLLADVLQAQSVEEARSVLEDVSQGEKH